MAVDFHPENIPQLINSQQDQANLHYKSAHDQANLQYKSAQDQTNLHYKPVQDQANLHYKPTQDQANLWATQTGTLSTDSGLHSGGDNSYGSTKGGHPGPRGTPGTIAHSPGSLFR